MNILNFIGKKIYAAAMLRLRAIIAVLSGTVFFSESKGGLTMNTLNIFGKRMNAAAVIRMLAVIAVLSGALLCASPCLAATVTLSSVTNTATTVTLNSPSATTTDFYVFGTGDRKSGGGSVFSAVSSDATIGSATDSPVDIAWSGGTPAASSAGTPNFKYARFGSGYSPRATYAQFTLTMPYANGIFSFWLRPNGNDSSITYEVTVGSVTNSYTDSYNLDLQCFAYSITGATVGEVVTVRVDNVSGGNSWHNVGFMAAQLSSGFAAEPTTQASGVNFTVKTLTSMTVNWSNTGNGSSRLVLMQAGSAVSSNPVDGTSYTANAAFGSGSPIGSAKVVYIGTGTSVNVTGLTSGTTYHVAIYDFNGSGGTENYLTTSPETGSAAAKSIPVIAQTSPVSATMSEDGNPTAWSTPTITATDADSDTLTWSKTSGSSYATVSGTGASPTITYSPPGNWNGSDSFVVRVTDADGYDEITVNVTVTAVNDAPVIDMAPMGVQIQEDESFTIPFSFFSVTDPDNTYPDDFSLIVQNGSNYTVSGTAVTPNSNYNGTLTVPVKVNDGGLDSNIWNLSVTVNAVNDAPVNTAIPTFSGNMVVGQTMTAASGTWNDTIDTAVSGTSTITYAYQWQRANDSSGTGVADISGATSGTYILTASDSGKYIRVKVTGTDNGVGTPATQSTDAFSVYKGMPTVTTGTESGVGMTSATFNGIVNAKDNASVTNIRFDYGTTTGYGLTINASPTTATGSSDTAVSATPTDLGAGVTYHYRAVATVDGVDVFGTDRTFTTATTAMAAPGYSLQFDGTNYVTCADTPFQIAAGTWEAWFKLDSFTAASQPVISKDGPGFTDDAVITILPDPDNGIMFRINKSDSTNQDVYSDSAVSTGTWYHAAVTWGAGGMKMYVNGVLQASTNANTSAIVSAGNNFLIGKRYGTTSDYFGGQIDEVRVWNAARTADQIRADMNKTLAGNESGLVAYYRFDHVSGSTLADHTANHNDGTLVNAPTWTDSDAFNVWTGTGSDWNTAGNWSDGLPTASSNVYIPSGGSQPSVSGSASCNHLVIASGATLTINGTLDVKGNIFNSGTIAGTGTLVCSGTSAQTVKIGSLSNLTVSNAAGITLDSNLTVNGTLTMISGSITPGIYTIAYGAGGTLVYNGSSAQTATNSEFPASSGPANLTISNAAGVILHALRTLSGALTLTSGAFSIGANTLTLNGGISVTSGTLTGGNTSDLILGGTGNVTLPANALTLNNLTLNRAGAVVTLGNNLTVKGTLTLTSGILKPAGYNLILDQNAAIAGTPSLSAMIQADGTGEVRKMFADGTASPALPVSFTFPVGSNSGAAEYSPVTLEFTDGSFTSAYAAVKLTDSQYSVKDDDSLEDYLERYWTLTQSGISDFSCDVTFDYVPADIQGDETKIYGKLYAETVWTTLDQSGGNQFTGTVTSFGVFTGADHTPVIATPLADVTVYEDVAPTSISLSSVFSDFDDDNLSVVKTVVSNTNPELVSAVISGETLTLSYTPNGNGSATVVIHGTANGKYAEDSITVTVIPVDDAPTSPGKIADLTVDEDAAPTVLSLSSVFADIDSAAVAKSLVSDSNTALVTAVVEGDILTLTYLPDQNGTADIVIRGSADGQSVEVAFKVTVNAVDDLPVWISEIEDLKVTDGDPDTVISLAGRVTDIDNDETKISFSVKSGNGSLVSPSVTGNTLTLKYGKDHAGKTEVTVTALSGGKTVSDTFSVTVEPLRYSVSGNVSYFSNKLPVPNMKMMLRGTDFYTGNAVSADILTDASGNYLFSDTVRGNYTVTPFKNEPLDPKKLSATDSEVIADVAVGARTLTPLQEKIADVTLNGRVSGLDASRLGRFTAGLSTDMSGSGSSGPAWISEPESLSFSLNADTGNQNFTAALSGDVSGNYSPGSSDRPVREPGRLTEITAAQGSVLRVPVVINDDTEILGIDIDIEYDETAISAREATLEGGILTYRDYETAVNLNEPGRIRMAVFRYSGRSFTASGTVVNLYFDVIGPVYRSSDLTFTRFDCNEITVSDGHEKERDGTISGGFYADSTVSDALRISVVPAEDYDPMTYDMNDDGRIDMRDALQALQDGYLEGAVRSLQILTGI